MDQPHPDTALNTYSGGTLDLAAPDPEAIEIADIAHGLSFAPRFGGQAVRFKSVAEHAVHVSALVAALDRSDLELAALHHDSHEAYACDLPRPLKQLIGGAYKQVTQRLDAAIAAAFKFDLPEAGSEEAKLIKAADDAVFVIEASDLLTGVTNEPQVDLAVLEQARKIVGTADPWAPSTADEEFSEYHRRCVRDHA